MPIRVSVIVAVYNAEPWIRRCLDSLMVQTLHDFEVILIDDGSFDSSGGICDEYATKDSRYRVIHKSNGGVSSARQCGIDNAVGEYVIHVDADDWIEPDMLLQLLEFADKDRSDMVICDFMIDEAGGTSKYIMQKPSALDHETVLRELLQQLHGSCCNKLVKRACYNRYGIRFPIELSFREDTFVNIMLLQENIKISYLPHAYYHYSTGDKNSLCSIDLSRQYSQQKTLLELLRQGLRGGIQGNACCPWRMLLLFLRFGPPQVLLGASA